MKKVLFVLTVLLAACMICSCGGGSGSSGSGSAQKAVAVGFDVTMIGAPEKVISASDPDYSNLEFWYRALPQWTSKDGFDIQGDTRKNSAKDDNNFVKTTAITYQSQTGTIGYFAQGKWAFDVEVRQPIINSTTNLVESYVVLWKTTSSVVEFINTTTVTAASPVLNIDIPVEKNIDSTKSGTIAFNVTAPKTADDDIFEVTYLAVGTTGTGTPINGLTTGSNTNYEATLTGSASIPSGIYAITVKYYSDDTKAHLVGISTVAAEVIPGDTVTISGSIENGKWQQTAFTIKGMYKLTIDVTAGSINDKGTVTVSGTKKVTFTCEPTITNIDDSAVTDTIAYTYEWRINGTKQSGSEDEFEYTLTAGDANSYLYVDCIAYFKDSNNTVIGSASRTFRLVVEP